jgi:hypothetical protein
MKYLKVTPKQIAALRAKVSSELFSYQRNWLNAGIYQRNRMITKCRQLGADWAFSLEALIDVLTTKRNQYFIADTDYQAETTRNYVIAHLKSVGVKVSELHDLTFNGGYKIEFIDKETYLAGKYGNAYFAEFAWSEHPDLLIGTASWLSKNERYRRTYYTTPSHSLDACHLWDGTSVKPVSDDTFRSFGGMRGIDGIWRQTVTIDDAIKGGCILLNAEKLITEFSQDDYDMLFMGKWPGLKPLVSGVHNG